MHPRREVLEQHVAALTAVHGLDWYDGASEVAVEFEDGGLGIIVPPIRGQVSYIVALHEIGHHVMGRADGMLDDEVAAWAWALDNACVELTHYTRLRIAERFYGYLHTHTPKRHHWRFYCYLLT